MGQKIVCSHDVVFLEDQTIDNFKKSNKSKSSPSNPINLCPDTSLKSLDDGRANADDDTHDSHEAEKSADGVHTESHA